MSRPLDPEISLPGCRHHPIRLSARAIPSEKERYTSLYDARCLRRLNSAVDHRAKLLESLYPMNFSLIDKSFAPESTCQFCRANIHVVVHPSILEKCEIANEISAHDVVTQAQVGFRYPTVPLCVGPLAHASGIKQLWSLGHSARLEHLLASAPGFQSSIVLPQCNVDGIHPSSQSI